MTSLTGLIGREYLRVSAKGNRSIPEQHDDDGNAADREGITLGAAYEDRGSASRYATRPRDDFASWRERPHALAPDAGRGGGSRLPLRL